MQTCKPDPLEFESNPFLAQLSVCRLSQKKEQLIDIKCTKGNIVLDDAKPWKEKLLIHHHSGTIESIGIPEIEPLKIECTHFLECCETRATPKTNAEKAINVIHAIEVCHNKIKKCIALKNI